MKSGTSLTDAEIEKFIEENEGWLEVFLKDTTVSITSPGNPTNKAHLFGSALVEHMTIMDCKAAVPMSDRTLEEAFLTLNVSVDKVKMYMDLLKDKGVADFVRKGGS